MQKFLLNVLSFLTLTLIAPLSGAAQPYVVDIDHADNVTFDINDVVVTGIHDGVNQIEMNGEQWLRVIANPGIVFTEVTWIDTYDNIETNLLEKGELATLSDGREYIDLRSGFPETESFRIRTKASAEARTASYTVTIDDPSKATLIVKGQAVTLTAGENTVEFDPATESKIEIQPLEYNSIYSITLNGTEVTRERYNYDLTVADGDKIVVTTQYPDVDCAVKFTLVGDDVADFIREVDVNGRPELNWNKDGFTVKCGSELTLRGRTDEYEILQFLVNEKVETFSAETTLFITEDTEIYISVQKYASFKITLRVSSPEEINVYRGFINNGDKLELTEGDNIVDIRRDNPFVTVQPAEGFYVDVIKVTDQPDYEADELKLMPLKVGGLTDNNVIEITTAKIVRDKTASLFLYNLAAAGSDFSIKRADASTVELAEGYSTLPFYDRDNEFTFANPATTTARMYINDEAVAAEGYNFYASLADGDAVKVFFDFAPASHNVDITLENATEEHVEITRDHVRSTPLESFKALTHTHVSIAPKNGTALEVSLDDAPLQATDGAYSFTVTADAKVKISAPETSITEISASSAAKAYDLQGRRVAHSTRGIIIVNGRKIKN